ncbi:hypothetical protein HPULCUR_005729 [Helicostylum pulchrum]|uniref:Uncharacterized protein n=1 Tax=Helicostylum pulchrum TaxID=562976 RepID=A0ABP9Y176_9FUNG
MLVLSDLLKALPPLRCHKSWSGLWLMDTPLRVAVNNSTYQTDAQSTATVVAKKNLASSFSIRCQPTRVYKQLQESTRGLKWISAIAKFMPTNAIEYARASL